MYVGSHPPTKNKRGLLQGKGLDYIVWSPGQIVLTISAEHKKEIRHLSSKLANTMLH